VLELAAEEIWTGVRYLGTLLSKQSILLATARVQYVDDDDAKLRSGSGLLLLIAHILFNMYRTPCSRHLYHLAIPRSERRDSYQIGLYIVRRFRHYGIGVYGCLNKADVVVSIQRLSWLLTLPQVE
jgi:hypothetical protein